MVKRGFDIVLALSALVLLSPLMAVLGVWVKVDSPGPLFFRQVRVGRGGREFRIFKFRTMRQDAERQGPQITVGEDPRITSSGRFLRRYKLDELPQFMNVLKGDMSVVGPRPEVPRYVAIYPEDARRVILSVRPGITDRASIEFRDENDILEGSKNPEADYVEKILPLKLNYYEHYVREQSLAGDMQLIVATVRAIFQKWREARG